MSTVQAVPLARPVWSRLRWWLAVGAVVLVGGVAVASATGAPDPPLDPDSPSHAGAKAVASLLRRHGVAVRQADTLATVQGTVLVPFPANMSAADLQSLRRRAEVLVLLGPTRAQLPGWRPAAPRAGITAPGCEWAGAVAGPVALPVDTSTWSAPGQGVIRCYGGAYVRQPTRSATIVVLSSSALLRNDRLGDVGVAALALNALTDSGRAHTVTWLGPLAGSAEPTRSFWELFPGGVERVAVWLLVVVGGLLALWQGRRFGPVVEEPLPVVVHAAELVEGHGRLYRRAGARDRAAAALRAGTRARLARRLGLSGNVGLDELVLAVTSTARLLHTGVADTLAGPVPADDTELLDLGRRLLDLERAVADPADSMAR